jgi:hypothetical protein
MSDRRGSRPPLQQTLAWPSVFHLLGQWATVHRQVGKVLCSIVSSKILQKSSPMLKIYRSSVCFWYKLTVGQYRCDMRRKRENILSSASSSSSPCLMVNGRRRERCPRSKRPISTTTDTCRSADHHTHRRKHKSLSTMMLCPRVAVAAFTSRATRSSNAVRFANLNRNSRLMAGSDSRSWFSTATVPEPPTSNHAHTKLASPQGKIIYTETDEAPALATYSLYPVVAKASTILFFE